MLDLLEQAKYLGAPTFALKEAKNPVRGSAV